MKLDKNAFLQGLKKGVMIFINPCFPSFWLCWSAPSSSAFWVWM